MARVKSLLSKYLKQFTIYTILIVLCCSPLFIYIIQFFYEKYMDTLITLRVKEFTSNRLATFLISDIDEWNKYNSNLLILSDSNIYKLNTVFESYFYKDYEKNEYLYRVMYKKIQIQGVPYILMCRIPIMEPVQLFKIQIAQLVLIYMILFLSSIVIQRLITKKIWAPFYDSLKKIEHYNLGGDIPQFKATDIMEFSRLNEIITNLMSNNLQIYKQQKEFIENASHELQTPLAVFLSQLDIIIQEPNLTEEQIHILQSLYSISTRLTRLNKNLLLLAKIDNNQFKDMQDIDFIGFLNTSLSYFKYQAEAQKIEIDAEIDGLFVIMANKSLLEIMINNLIVNAILHNIADGGRISMKLRENVFIISNTGENKTLDTNRMFKRFNRISEEKKGNGLGLSIIYQICKFHKWKLEYQHLNGMHTFIVNF
jgi:signal transduction histidine kinase